MKYNVMRKWVKALRSGKYKQGVGKLKSSNGSFCCLGVLRDISPYPHQPSDALTSVLGGPGHQRVRNWSGLRTACGHRIDNHDARSLASFNDSGWSFKRIATFIEKNWRRL